jgi:mannose-1-phosphate guanylyltransferase/mannose-6-phosphate isomerase
MKEDRGWGFYEVLAYDRPSVKLKRLTVEPGKSLSKQRHFKRSELWFVESGVATIEHNGNLKTITEFDTISINVREWHKLMNLSNDPLTIIEIQYGTECSESDIEREYRE